MTQPIQPSRDPHSGIDPSLEPADVNGKAIASLVLGLLSFLFSFFAGVPAVVVGSLSLGEIARGNNRLAGRPLAISGIVLGCVGSIVSLIWISMFYFSPAVQVKRETAAEMQAKNRLKMIGLAILGYEDRNNKLPAPAMLDEDGRPLVSWRVELLPYLEEQALYQRFNLDEPWNSRHNSPLAAKAPSVYVSATDKSNKGAETNVVAILGDETLWPPDRQITISRVPDGMPNTILLVELAGTGIKWSEPRDLSIKEFLTAVRRQSGPGAHPINGRFLTLFGDGSVQTLDAEMAAQDLEALLTRAGGEPVVMP